MKRYVTKRLNRKDGLAITTKRERQPKRNVYKSKMVPNPAFSGHGYAVGYRWRFEGEGASPAKLLDKHAVPLTQSLGWGRGGSAQKAKRESESGEDE